MTADPPPLTMYTMDFPDGRRIHVYLSERDLTPHALRIDGKYYSITEINGEELAVRTIALRRRTIWDRLLGRYR